MSVAEVILLAFLQGLTEFLPVSSSGHLLAARLLFGISDASGLAVDAFLHLGTLSAVIVYFWRTWWRLATNLIKSDDTGRDQRELAGKLIIATLPAAAVGYALQAAVAADRFRSPAVLGGAFLVTAATLWVAEYVGQRRPPHPRASYRDALTIGFVQIAALLPGISRSGVTIAAGRARGLSRLQATKFSFLISAPIIAGAGLITLPDLINAHAIEPSAMLLGFIVSFASGLAAIHALIKIVERVSFTPFVAYLIILALVILARG